MQIDDEGGADVPQQDDEMWKTLVRFSREPLTADDSADLERWRANDPTRAEMVNAIQRLASVARRPRAAGRSHDAWSRMNARLAGAAALATPGHDGRGEVAHGARRPFRALTGEHATSRAPRQQRRRTTIALLAGLAATLLIGFTAQDRLLSLIGGERPVPPMRELVTRAGERADVHLEDGSRVVLAPMSRLRYGRLVGEPTRTVELEGEGYFEVAADAERPFVVKARHAAVQAVGTAFAVQAHAGDSLVQVITTHGLVALRPVAAGSGTGTLVEHGELGTLTTGGVARVVAGADVEHAVAWTEGRLTYQMVPLADVVRDLERWYDLEITIADPAVSALRVTLTLEDATAADAVDRLGAMLSVPVVHSGRTVRVGAK